MDASDECSDELYAKIRDAVKADRRDELDAILAAHGAKKPRLESPC